MDELGSINTGLRPPDSPPLDRVSAGVQPLIAEPPLRQCRNKLRGALSQSAVDTGSRAVAEQVLRHGSAQPLKPCQLRSIGSTLPPCNETLINIFNFNQNLKEIDMKKSNTPPVTGTDPSNIDDMNVVNLDFTPMLSANDIGTTAERDTGKPNPYAHVGYSIVMTNLLRGLYAAQVTAKNHFDRTEDQERAHHVKLGGDKDIIESDDMADNFRKRVAQSKIQWYNITCMVDELQSKFKAITNAEPESFAQWLEQKEAWARGERKPVATKVDRKKTDELEAIAAQINVLDATVGELIESNS